MTDLLKLEALARSAIDRIPATRKGMRETKSEILTRIDVVALADAVLELCERLRKHERGIAILAADAGNSLLEERDAWKARAEKAEADLKIEIEERHRCDDERKEAGKMYDYWRERAEKADQFIDGLIYDFWVGCDFEFSCKRAACFQCRLITWHDAKEKA